MFAKWILITVVIIMFTACTGMNEKRESVSSSGVPPKDVTLALRPPMGWNSWDCLGFDANEAEVKATAEFMAKNLKQLGYEYVVLDMNWYAPDYSLIKASGITTYNFDSYGRLMPDTVKFPSSGGGKGFKPLADYIHSLGLKFGIHILGGVPVMAVKAGCPVKGTSVTASSIISADRGGYWYETFNAIDLSKPGGQEYYNSIFELYADWGVDYIKADYLALTSELIGISRAGRTCGRSMILSAVPDRIPEAILKENAHMARMGIDLWDNWEWLKRSFTMAAITVKEIEPGYWPDLDMLPAGMLTVKSPREGEKPHISKFTSDELYTLFTLWYIARSPLMLGGYLPQTDQFTLDLITNKEALEVNRNSINNRQIYQFDTQFFFWTADIPGSDDRYIALFNVSEKKDLAVGIDWNQLGLQDTVYKVRDLWRGKDLGSFNRRFSSPIPPHGAGLYKITR